MKPEQPDHRVTARSVVGDRRTTPRIELAIQATVGPDGVPVTLLNLSPGGFLMSSRTAYDVDSTHTFRFKIATQMPLVLRGRVVHAARLTVHGDLVYLAGVEFIDQHLPASAEAIALLMAMAVGNRSA